MLQIRSSNSQKRNVYDDYRNPFPLFDLPNFTYGTVGEIRQLMFVDAWRGHENTYLYFERYNELCLFYVHNE